MHGNLLNLFYSQIGNLNEQLGPMKLNEEGSTQLLISVQNWLFILY